MSKYLLWIVLGIIAVAVVYLAFNYVKKEAQPTVMSPAQLDEMTRAFSDEDMVVITLDDEVYHKPHCRRIRGATEKVILRLARERANPCAVCFPDVGGEQ
jgi:hypothetical protein